MDEFAWTVIGSAAGVVGAAAAIIFGLVPLLQSRRNPRDVPPAPDRVAVEAADGAGGPVVVVGEVPQEPAGFQSRAGLLAGLNVEGPVGRVVVVRAVTGMRGVGKTQLAAEYARGRLAQRWRLVAWINAEDRDELLAGLVAVAAALGLAAEDREAAGRAVRHWLETGGERCLLVFDNATDPAGLRPFLPAGGDAQVIITSNKQSLGQLGTGVPLEVFTEQEALAFLAERTGSADVRGAGELAAEVGCLPLALAQAAAVIAGQRLDYDTYLGRLWAVPAGQLLEPEEAGQYPRGVAESVLLSVEAARAGDDAELAAALLELLAVLSAAGVRRSTLHAAGRHGTLGDGGRTAAEVDGMLGRLAGASLLTFSVDGTSVTMHRLVMRVIREHAAASGTLAATCAAAGGLLDELADRYKESWHRDRVAVRDLVEQTTALHSASAACRNDPAVVGLMLRLRFRALWFLNELADSTTQAITIAESLLADQERVLGSDHPSTLRTRGNLASAYQDAGRTAEAIELDERNLADQERVLGGDHRDTLMTRNNLAGSYRDAGRTAEALATVESLLADQERVLGGDHPDTLATRGNLAIAYQGAGRTAEAIELHERNLADRERVLGRDHPDTLMTRNNLAIAYQGAGRTAEAIALHERNLADRERVLGRDHPNTLGTRSNLASAYQDAGRTAEAIELHERNLADQERVQGSDHPNTLGTRNNLALAYHDAGRTAEAIELHERNLADRERVLGRDHPDTLATRSNLASAYRQLDA